MSNNPPAFRQRSAFALLSTYRSDLTS